MKTKLLVGILGFIGFNQLYAPTKLWTSENNEYKDVRSYATLFFEYAQQIKTKPTAFNLTTIINDIYNGLLDILHLPGAQKFVTSATSIDGKMVEQMLGTMGQDPYIRTLESVDAVKTYVTQLKDQIMYALYSPARQQLY